MKTPETIVALVKQKIDEHRSAEQQAQQQAIAQSGARQALELLLAEIEKNGSGEE